MKTIIGCDIQSLINWLYFTKRYNTIENENETIVIEHLNSSYSFDLTDDNEVKKYMNFEEFTFYVKITKLKKE